MLQKTPPKTVKKPLLSELRELYWSKGLATRPIAKMLGTHQRAVIKLMNEYGIPRRDRITAVIKGCRKYEKVPFSGDPDEQAYILGLTLADFRRRRHGYQIDIALGTTHPGFAFLYKSLFAKYAPVREKPYFNKYTGRHNWRLETSLHPTFEFLLGPKRVPKWIMNNKEHFLHFLAGYTDGEGIVSISKNSKRCVAFIFAISTEDKSIQFSIFNGLKKLGFRPSVRRLKRAGSTNRFCGKILRYKKDVWMVRMKRRSEVLRLLRILPIKHPEKIKKRDVMFRFEDKVYIKDVYSHWKELRKQLKSDVENYISEAKEELSRTL